MLVRSFALRCHPWWVDGSSFLCSLFFEIATNHTDTRRGNWLDCQEDTMAIVLVRIQITARLRESTPRCSWSLWLCVPPDVSRSQWPIVISVFFLVELSNACAMFDSSTSPLRPSSLCVFVLQLVIYPPQLLVSTFLTIKPSLCTSYERWLIAHLSLGYQLPE